MLSDFVCNHHYVLSPAPNCFLRPREAQKAADEAKARFGHIDGEHMTLLNWCYDHFINATALKYADNVRRQLVGIMTRVGLKMCSQDFNSRAYHVNIKKALGVASWSCHCKFVTPSSSSCFYQIVQLHPSNNMDHKPQWVIFDKFVLTTRNFIRTVTDVRGEWLIDIAPHYYDLNNFPSCKAKRVLKRLYSKLERERALTRAQRLYVTPPIAP
nr:unnamed protein product [Digitaria exilis]